MVNTRSASEVDQPAGNRQGRSNRSDTAPHPGQMDPAMEQFFQTQTQLHENLTNTMANLQAQVNNPLVQQQAPHNKHCDFMSHHPQCSLM
jgi:hypothetical protein